MFEAEEHARAAPFSALLGGIVGEHACDAIDDC